MEGADWSELSVNIYGAGDAAFTLYEDDGETEGYLAGVYRKTDVGVNTVSSDVWNISVGGAQGNFATDYAMRRVTFRIHSDTPVTFATVNGVDATVTKIAKDENALPFANGGASNISDIYEISADVSVENGAEIRYTTGERDGLNVADTTVPVTEDKGADTDAPVTDGADGTSEKKGIGALPLALGAAAIGAAIGGACTVIATKKKKKS